MTRSAPKQDNNGMDPEKRSMLAAFSCHREISALQELSGHHHLLLCS